MVADFASRCQVVDEAPTIDDSLDIGVLGLANSM
ncbi:MAG: hypothetical protein ACI9SE_004658 [Neolewinella sp.]|jgi:hypothetical protein